MGDATIRVIETRTHHEADGTVRHYIRTAEDVVDAGGLSQTTVSEEREVTSAELPEAWVNDSLKAALAEVEKHREMIKEHRAHMEAAQAAALRTRHEAKVQVQTAHDRGRMSVFALMSEPEHREIHRREAAIAATLAAESQARAKAAQDAAAAKVAAATTDVLASATPISGASQPEPPAPAAA